MNSIPSSPRILSRCCIIQIQTDGNPKMEVMNFITGGGINVYILAGVIIICSACIWHVVERLWVRPRSLERLLRAQGLKGNPYRLLYGDTKEFVGMVVATQSKPIGLDEDIVPYVVPYPHHLLTKYGRRTWIWYGPIPRIMIVEADVIKEVLQKTEIFVKVEQQPLNKLFISGLVTYEGQKWATHRRLLNPSFALPNLKDMVSTMHISCDELVKELEIMLSNKTSNEVDVWPILSNFTADIISRTAFGSSYKEGQKIFLLQKEQAQIAVQLSRSFYIPGSRFLPTKSNQRMKDANKQMLYILKGIIQKKLEGMKVGAQNRSNNDLLGILLESSMKEVQENENRREMEITIEDVIEECKLFYFAGQETTSNLLVWTMVMLSIHQNWQMEAREEVFAVFGNNAPDFDGLHQLKTINMIIHEVLRLYPPASLMIRDLKESTKLDDLILPSGGQIVVPTILIHHDKEIWGEDAKEFKPERFAKGVAKAANGKLAAFFPFSLGPRICIGMNFAMVEAKIALVMILQRFSFELSPNYQHAPVTVLTLQPKFGAKLMVRKI